MAMEFTDQNFDQEVLQGKGVVLVYFWASWCGPCQMMGPIIDELAEEFENKAKIGKCGVEKNEETATKYDVMSIPTIKIFKYGKIIKEFAGAQNKEIIKEAIGAAL
ncbi:MAG TPA: thioredoxin [Candidatus Moranbacteria bacterium]|nr:thioredoxin [Candidatus Moranbacteria bacterium]